MTTKKPTSKTATKKTPQKKLPELTLEDVLRQAITLVALEEPTLGDLSDKERNLLVKEVLDDQSDALEAILRGYVITVFVDLFVDEDDEDEDKDEDEDEDEDDEDEDEEDDEE
jgi:hypothetical protein